MGGKALVEYNAWRIPLRVDERGAFGGDRML